MKHLPLYPGDRRELIERTEPVPYTPNCVKCALHETASTVCIPPEGEVGDNVLLVVGDRPLRDDDAIGVSFSAGNGMAFRAEVDERWGGQVVYTYATRCASGNVAISDNMVDACRGYLAALIEEVKPTRIIALGSRAYFALTGRKVPPYSVRRGYTYFASGVPVFPLMPINQMVYQNRFRMEHLREDLDFALTANPPDAPVDEVYRLVETEADAIEAAEFLSGFDSLTYDTEFSGAAHSQFFQVDTLAICPTERTEVYVWDEVSLKKPEVVAPLRGLLEDPAIEKVGQGLKVDITAVEECPNIRAKFAGAQGDTLIWRKLDDPDIMGRLAYQSEMVGMGGHKLEMEHALDDAVKTVEKYREEYEADHLDLPGVLPRALEAAVHYKGLDPLSFAYGIVASSLRSKYCALDVVSTSLLAKRIRPRVKKRQHLARVWNHLRHAPGTISQIERWGFRADRRQIESVGRFVDSEMAKLLPKLESHGVDFKLTQDKALSAYLFDHLNLPVLERTKSGNPSVAAGVLEKLQGRHPVIDLILAYKQYETVSQRYAWGLMDHVRADGRIHARFNITGTVSGRFSSSDPNMQNIPSRHPVLAKMVKNIFVASPGWRLVQIDYSQLEYRVAAILSGDPVMQQVFIDGLDLHRRTAELISVDAWNIPQATMEAYSKDQVKPYRSESKQVNFGTLYGLGPTTLAKDLGISVTKAKKLIHLIMGQFVDLDAWVKGQIKFAKRKGYVHTYIDGKAARWRPLWNIDSPDEGQQSGARNSSINSPVQGTAADYMLRSLNEVVAWFLGDAIPARVVGTVHDSMVLEIREDWVEEVTETIVDIMESWWSGKVPILADVEHGLKWGALSEVEKDRDGSLIWAA